MTAPHPNIADQPWLSASATRAVMGALQAVGGEGCARFVGGCVRNAILGQPVDDIDIATPLTPDQVIAAVKRAELKAVPTGVAHGTVTAVSDGQPFEITTLRRDVETDGRRAVVAFTDDWGEDAQRRDFRLNALYADAQGRLFDPTGEGLADAQAGRIVFVGDAETRIAEDALRILRFFRFQAWYGRGPPDAAALAACSTMKARISGLSAERISKELLKLLAAPDPRAVVRTMAETGVLAEILPASAQSHEPGNGRLEDLSRFDRLIALEPEAGAGPDPLLRLAALLPPGADAAAFAAWLRLSNPQRDRLVAALAEGPAITAQTSLAEARRQIYRLGAAAFADRLRLAWAAAAPGGAAAWRAALNEAQAWRVPVFPLTGDDALAAGLAKGPSVGEGLRAVEAAWIEGDFCEDRKSLLAKLRRFAGALS